MKFRETFLAASACTLLAIPAAAQDLVFKNEAGASVTIYGQLSMTYQGVDDGEDTYNELVDNSNSTSRAGLWVEWPFDESRFRFNFESGFGLRNTSESSQTDNVNWIDWQRTDLRKIEGTFDGGFGAVWLGQGSMATDGAAEIDNSGTSIVGYVNVPDSVGSFQFRNGNQLSGVKVSDAFKDLDGPRRLRARYDTPKFSGFYVSGAYGQEVLASGDDADYYDAAVRYGLKNDMVAIDAAVGYAWKRDGGTTEQIIGSGSLIHVPSGVNLTVAAGDARDTNGTYGYVKLGWKGKVFDFGGTALSVDYYGGSDFSSSGSDSETWGIQAVQTVEDLKLEAYLGYRLLSFDDNSAASYQDMSTLLAGGRWKF